MLTLARAGSEDAARDLAYGVARRVIAAQRGLEPVDVRFRREPCPACGGPHGRPAVDGPPGSPHFSISRSGCVVLVGVAEAPIGVDVEALATRELAEEVSSLLHPEERGEIVAAAPEMRALVFTRLWARKEAYLKGIGIGVTGDLAADYVGSEGRAPGPAGWTVLDVPVGTGHRAAVALRSPAR